MTNLLILGEAFGEEEARQGRPFVGSSGRVLNYFLRNAGIDRRRCHVTNVFNLRPAGNDIETLCGPKAEGIPDLAPLRQGKYFRAEYAPEFERLDREVRAAKPNLVLALGNTALLAATGSSGVRKMRGYPTWSDRWSCKVLATYHPAAVIRQWNLNPIVHADMVKVAREQHYPEIRRPNREIWISPTIEDLFQFERDHIIPNRHLALSVDIETQAGQITCIGFAPTPHIGLVLPFVDWTKPGNNYWPAITEEVEAYKWMRRILTSAPSVLGQNFGYDIKYLYRYGIPVPGYNHDTMLHSHAQQPELEKGLNFLASVHTEEASWKFMRSDIKTIKTED